MNTNFLGLIFIHMVTFEPSSNKQGIAGMKVLTGILGEEAVVGLTFWEFKSHLFKALVPPTFTYGTGIWGGNLNNSMSQYAASSGYTLYVGFHSFRFGWMNPRSGERGS